MWIELVNMSNQVEGSDRVEMWWDVSSAILFVPHCILPSYYFGSLSALFGTIRCGKTNCFYFKSEQCLIWCTSGTKSLKVSPRSLACVWEQRNRGRFGNKLCSLACDKIPGQGDLVVCTHFLVVADKLGNIRYSGIRGRGRYESTPGWKVLWKWHYNSRYRWKNGRTVLDCCYELVCHRLKSPWQEW